MNILKITALVGAVCLAAFLGYKYMTADPPGYCPDQKRVLSDEEFIYIALRGPFEHGQLKLDVSDTTVQTYYANHPKCCTVTKGDSSLFGRGIFGYGFAAVSITYEMSAQEIIRRNEPTGTLYNDNTDITACGKIVDWMGMSESPPADSTKQKYTQ